MRNGRENRPPGDPSGSSSRISAPNPSPAPWRSNAEIRAAWFRTMLTYLEAKFRKVSVEIPKPRAPLLPGSASWYDRFACECCA